ncbi:hypothetical protein V5T82_15145 [Magnetovibrio sp. PR-2]|uniref:hypothetical protein n=1 Tax=Magnetovibrio sp. PR-2 TaxID=3120356 RepID=UPI002FCE38C7
MSRFLDMHPDFIDLRRRYESVPLDQEELDGSSILSTVALMKGEEPGKLLYELVSHPLTVVLGEARSGKTTEFRLAADELRANGQAAFFVRIEDLSHAQASPESIANALELDAEEAFDGWLTCTEEAVFFLDSVDEAKLQQVGDYRRAIRVFQKSLRQHLHRIRLAVSCRVTEWRPKDDIAPLRELLPFLAKPLPKREEPQEDFTDAELGLGAGADAGADDQVSDNDVSLVQILPLDTDRITVLAEVRALGDVQEFLDAIRETDAEEFAGRPGDAIDLIELWKEKQRLGTLTELTQHNVTRKLTEEAEAYKDVISAARAREGAERLAAASMLCGAKSFRFAKPEQDPHDALPALNPYDLLPDWQPDEVQALLRRPIFDEATYGRVRFHTEGVRQYLAASWFRVRHEQGCPPRDLLGVFFIQRYGRTVINPTLTTVAAWLAPYVPELMDAVLAHNPEILPDEGDPQAIPVDIRKRVLRDYASRYAGRKRTGHSFDRNGLRRFAHEDLAETINELLLDKATPHDIRTMLLDVVELRKIQGCVEIVSAIALDKNELSDVRVDALGALRACGATDELRKVYAQLLKAKKVPNRLYGWAIYELFPVAIEADELLALIQKAQTIFAPPFKHIEDLLERRLNQTHETKQLQVLIPTLLDWVKPSAQRKGNKLGPTFWLYGSLCICIDKWLEQSNDAPDWMFAALKLIEDQPGGDYGERNSIAGIRASLGEKPQTFRKVYFEHRHTDYAAQHEDGDIYYYQLRCYHELFELVYDDVPWLLDMVDQTQDDRLRFTAFNAAVDLSHVNGLEYKNAEKLEQRAKSHPQLIDHWQKVITPRPRRVWEYMNELRGWTGKLKKRWRRVKAQEYFLPRLPDITVCKNSSDLAGMYDWMRHSGHTYSARDPESLEPLFGQQGVDAFRQGLKVFWKTWEVSTDKPGGPTKVGDHMALVGVACEVADGFDFFVIDQDTAERLTRLAFKELHLPSWFPELLRHHEAVVKAIVFPWLESDISIEQDSQAHPSILSDIVMSSPEVVSLFYDFVYKNAARNMPMAINVRRNVVRMLAEHNGGNKLAEMAGSYLRNKRALTPLHLYWLAIWFQTDAIPALDWLESRLSKLSEKCAKNAVITFTSMLDTFHSGDAVIPVTPAYKCVPVMRRFIPIIHHYLPSEEAPEHHGCFKPDRKDYAYTFRGTLVGALADIPGDGAYHALLEIRDQTEDPYERDWMTKRADDKIGRDGQNAWVPCDVLEFENKHEHAPRTADNLFDIGQKRLIEIKDKLERGDTSLRDLFDVKTDESLLQKYMAERLGELARGRYSVVREAEVDNEKEPDIRLLFADINSTTIEIKWAHKWRLVELEEALTDQLVSQYLKAEDSGHGILLVVNAENGKTWSKRGMKQNFSFDALLNHLSVMAHEIERTTPGVSRLEIIGIDVSR